MDDDADVANFFETETVMRIKVCGIELTTDFGLSFCVADGGYTECIRLRTNTGVKYMQFRRTCLPAHHIRHCAVPLFWMQSGYSLKPPPVISSERTHDQHLSTLKHRFWKTLPHYGPHVSYQIRRYILSIEDELLCRPSLTWQNSEAGRKQSQQHIKIAPMNID